MHMPLSEKKHSLIDVISWALYGLIYHSKRTVHFDGFDCYVREMGALNYMIVTLSLGRLNAIERHNDH